MDILFFYVDLLLYFYSKSNIRPPFFALNPSVAVYVACTTLFVIFLDRLADVDIVDIAKSILRQTICTMPLEMFESEKYGRDRASYQFSQSNCS